MLVSLANQRLIRFRQRIEIAFRACMQYMDELEPGLQTPGARSSCASRRDQWHCGKVHAESGTHVARGWVLLGRRGQSFTPRSRNSFSVAASSVHVAIAWAAWRTSSIGGNVGAMRRLVSFGSRP